MNTSTPSTPTLSQALTRKRANPLPAILLALGLIIAVTFAVLGYLESQRTEPVVVLIRDVPYGQQITPEDVGTVELPLHRPTQLAGIISVERVVGQYAARNLSTNDLAQPTMLMAEPPDQPVYPNGEQLTADMVPVPFATGTIGPLTYRDRVNIGFNDPEGSPELCKQAQGGVPAIAGPRRAGDTTRAYACRFLSYVRVLYVDESASTAYLELTPYQAHALWALQAAGLQLWGERYGVSSAALPVLDRLDISQLNATELTTSTEREESEGTNAAR